MGNLKLWYITIKHCKFIIHIDGYVVGDYAGQQALYVAQSFLAFTKVCSIGYDGKENQHICTLTPMASIDYDGKTANRPRNHQHLRWPVSTLASIDYYLAISYVEHGSPRNLPKYVFCQTLTGALLLIFTPKNVNNFCRWNSASWKAIWVKCLGHASTQDWEQARHLISNPLMLDSLEKNWNLCNWELIKSWHCFQPFMFSAKIVWSIDCSLGQTRSACNSLRFHTSCSRVLSSGQGLPCMSAALWCVQEVTSAKRGQGCNGFADIGAEVGGGGGGGEGIDVGSGDGGGCRAKRAALALLALLDAGAAGGGPFGRTSAAGTIPPRALLDALCRWSSILWIASWRASVRRHSSITSSNMFCRSGCALWMCTSGGPDMLDVRFGCALLVGPVCSLDVHFCLPFVRILNQNGCGW